MKRLVLVDYGYYIGKKRSRILIKKASTGEKREFNIGDFDEIVLHVKGTSISGDALYLMLRMGVKIYLMGRSKLLGVITPVLKGSSIYLKKNQFKTQESERGFYLAKAFIYGKIRNQALYLSDVRRRFKRRDFADQLLDLIWILKDLASRVSQLDYKPDGRREIIRIEAEAARRYWDFWSSILKDRYGFDGRRKHYEEPRDPVNLSLNYLYMLLAGYTWNTLILNGFEPYLGFLHEDSARRPALVMDLMEEFRVPVVDAALFNWILIEKPDLSNWIVEDNKLSDEARRTLLTIYFNRIDEEVTFMNKTTKLKYHIDLQAKRLARYVMGYTNSYEPFKYTR